MLFSKNGVGGYRSVSGAARGGLGAGNPYTCNATICYGSDGGATHALFKEAQYQMNRDGKAVFGTGWAAIGVDGFIGSKTVAAARKLFPKVNGLSKFANPPTFETLSRWIYETPSIVDTLRIDADRRTGHAEPSGAIQTRTDAFQQEGPAHTSASGTTQPNVTVNNPPAGGGSVSTPVGPTGGGNTGIVPGSQVSPAGGLSPYQDPGGRPTARGNRTFVWIMAGVVTVGLVGAALAVKHRRSAHA